MTPRGTAAAAMRGLLLLATLLLGACASAPMRVDTQAADYAEAARSSETGCFEQPCQIDSPLLALGDAAYAESTPGAPRAPSRRRMSRRSSRRGARGRAQAHAHMQFDVVPDADRIGGHSEVFPVDGAVDLQVAVEPGMGAAGR